MANRSRIILWAVVALPAVGMCGRLVSGAEPGELLHGSGESSARLMIIALMLTPLRMLFPDVRAIQWLRQHRRDLGVAAFAYAALHTVLYLVDMGGLKYVLDELAALGIWTGWLALLAFMPLAITSNDAAVARLGGSWSSLHRLAYVAAVLTLIHWIYVHNNVVPAWIHFTPLIVLELIRVVLQRRKKRHA